MQYLPPGHCSHLKYAQSSLALLILTIYAFFRVFKGLFTLGTKLVLSLRKLYFSASKILLPKCTCLFFPLSCSFIFQFQPKYLLPFLTLFHVALFVFWYMSLLNVCFFTNSFIQRPFISSTVSSVPVIWFHSVWFIKSVIEWIIVWIQC